MQLIEDEIRAPRKFKRHNGPSSPSRLLPPPIEEERKYKKNLLLTCRCVCLFRLTTEKSDVETFSYKNKDLIVTTENRASYLRFVK